jgi:hypothetical protein
MQELPNIASQEVADAIGAEQNSMMMKLLSESEAAMVAGGGVGSDWG